MASKVYYMNDRANSIGESTPFKAVKLLRDAGLADMIKPGYTVGIKIHTGCYGNSLNLRPHWVKSIVEEVQRMGAYPVIVETNFNINGFGGDRQDTLTHREIISRHGFNEATMGCPVWLPTDIFGIEGVKCDVPHGVYLNHTFVAEHMLKLDAVIVVSHFKGHSQGTFGGAIKNIGIGMASGRGKSATHFISHPDYGVNKATVNQEVAQRIMAMPHPNVVDGLVNCCAFKAYEIVDGELVFHNERCKNCSACYYPALFSGVMNINPIHYSAPPVSIADSCAGIMNKIGKEKFIFVNYAYDITPGCDCANWHDATIIPNLGTFVSKDPVAVDMACLEAAEAAEVVPGSAADTPELTAPNTERFTNASSMAKVSQWAQINSAIYNGIGSSEYELIESEPLDDAEILSWISDFGPGKPTGMVYADVIRKANLDTEGPTAVAEPRVPLNELYVRPAGIVSKKNIGEVQ